MTREDPGAAEMGPEADLPPGLLFQVADLQHRGGQGIRQEGKEEREIRVGGLQLFPEEADRLLLVHSLVQEALVPARIGGGNDAYVPGQGTADSSGQTAEDRDPFLPPGDLPAEVFRVQEQVKTGHGAAPPPGGSAGRAPRSGRRPGGTSR